MPPSKQDKPKPPKLIKLDDLIPTRDVTGGRKSVFGSTPAAPAAKKKTHK